jgi:hypothetical protein
MGRFIGAAVVYYKEGGKYINVNKKTIDDHDAHAGLSFIRSGI